MNRYTNTAHRPLFGLAAVALTAATMALTVLVPAVTLDGANAAPRVLASQGAGEPVRIEPSRIEVIGARATVVADERAAERPAS